MGFEGSSLVDWPAYARARAELGMQFVRILGYFEEDGSKSVLAIEEAMRAQNAVGMVIPAHTLKGEARQFGAEPLADLAEAIEMFARDCVERREDPAAALTDVVQLRPLFQATLALLRREANPLAERRSPGGFGRKQTLGGI